MLLICQWETKQSMTKYYKRPTRNFAVFAAVSNGLLTYTVVQENCHPFSFHYIFYKCWPISIIFGTHYTELICNITIIDLPTSPTYCCCTTLQKKSVAKILTLPNKLHVLLYKLTKHPLYPHNQSALNPKYYSKCLKCPPFSFTQAWSLVCHSSTASSTMLCNKSFQVSIKHYLRSATSRTGVWYTRSGITPHIR